ncbi:MAG: hypothetical protein RLO51_16870 [Thalassobaculum sp.]|uniref:hypothetical protein n=1 Tax=Thalassobaculum sp. TaxID=2022740 RepID=UPI0032EB65EB
MPTTLKPDPAAVLAVLYAETTASLDTKTDDPADVLGNRVRALQDVLFTLPTDDPAALRIQADATRALVRDFNHDGTTAAILMLAATYAERLAVLREGAQ